KAASAASTTPDEAFPAARLPRALRATTVRARRFVARRFAGRVVRFERDFGAMIPPPWPAPAWHGVAVGATPKEVFPPMLGVLNYGNPTTRRMSAGVAPAARSSRKPVALVDLDSFRPAPSRIRRWCR